MQKKNKHVLKNTQLMSFYEQLRRTVLEPRNENSPFRNQGASLFRQQGMASWIAALSDWVPLENRVLSYEETKQANFPDCSPGKGARPNEVILLLTELALHYLAGEKEA